MTTYTRDTCEFCIVCLVVKIKYDLSCICMLDTSLESAGWKKSDNYTFLEKVYHILISHSCKNVDNNSLKNGSVGKCKFNLFIFLLAARESTTKLKCLVHTK